jgi:hypothetical protein
MEMETRTSRRDLTTPTIEQQLVRRIARLEREVERLHAVEGPVPIFGFSATLSVSQNNIATGSNVTVQFDTETYDIGSNFDTATYTFTAPVAGYYRLIAYVRFDGVDTASDWVRMRISTTRRNYDTYFPSNQLVADANRLTLVCTTIADMGVSNTALVQVQCQGGAAQTDIVASGQNSRFMGWLIA